METVAFTIAAIVAWATSFPLWASLTLTALAVLSLVGDVGESS